MSTRTETVCDWCGRNDRVDSITDDRGDTYHWCTRHEDQVRSLVEEPAAMADRLTDDEREDIANILGLSRHVRLLLEEYERSVNAPPPRHRRRWFARRSSKGKDAVDG